MIKRGQNLAIVLEGEREHARPADSGFVQKVFQFDECQFKYPFLKEGSRFIFRRFAS
jgi:hypothetical protein